MIRCQITAGSHIDPRADYVQIRPGDLEAVRQAMRVHPRVLVNDRLDIALALGAAGVHLRSNSISPKRIRRITPDEFIITVACHSLGDVLAAGGADYALVSPVFHSISKDAASPPLGLEALRYICGRSPVPVLALGGITESRANECIAAGAAGVAAISMFRG